jgi:hypothetical protein
LVLKDVLLARRIYRSSLLRWRWACLVLKDVFYLPGEFTPRLLRWRYALHALFICSSSHSHHRHYACTLPLSKSVPVLLDSFDFEKNLQFLLLFGVSQKTEPPLQFKKNLCLLLKSSPKNQNQNGRSIWLKTGLIPFTLHPTKIN